MSSKDWLMKVKAYLSGVAMLSVAMKLANSILTWRYTVYTCTCTCTCRCTHVIHVATLNWYLIEFCMYCHHFQVYCIRESVDSLCRDGADTPIVRVHRKAFLTRERSRSKPFWAPSYSIPVVFYPTIPPK